MAKLLERFGVVPAFDEHDPARHQDFLVANFSFGGLDGACGFICNQKMATGDPARVGEYGQLDLRHPLAVIIRTRVVDCVAKRRHQSALPFAEARPYFAQRARDVAEIWNRRCRPWRRVVESREVVGARNGARRNGFIERKKFRRTFERDIAASAQETGNAGAFGHVLASVPGVKLAASLRRDVVPDGDRTFSRKAHSECPPVRVLRCRAGLPATVAPCGTSRVTTLPAPITAQSPMVMPGRMIAPPPIQTSRPISILLPNSRPPFR